MWLKGPVPNGRGLRDLCLMGVALVLLGLYCACSHISSNKSRQKLDSNGKVSDITLLSNLNVGHGQMIENSFLVFIFFIIGLLLHNNVYNFICLSKLQRQSMRLVTLAR